MSRRFSITAMLGVVVFVVIAWVAYGQVAPHARVAMAPDDFVLSLSSDKTSYTLGEKPRFTVTLKNNSIRTLLLLPHLDGSDFSRYPPVNWHITPPENALAIEQVFRCGNTNPLQATDFRRIFPGDSLDLCPNGYGPLRELERGPGEFRVQVTYSTDEEDIGRWIGGPLGAAAEAKARLTLGPLLGEVPRFTCSSNVLNITFEPFQASLLDILQSGSVEEIIYALRLLEGVQRDTETASVVLLTLMRFADPTNRQHHLIAAKALKVLAANASEDQLDHLWQWLQAALEAGFGRTVCTDDTASSALVQAVLAMPRPQRGERLLALFTRHTYEWPDASANSIPVDMSPEILQLLADTTGEDIDMFLQQIITHRDHDAAFTPYFEQALAIRHQQVKRE